MASEAIKVGDLGPAFTLPSTEGRPISLKEYRGQMVVLYFYPQDDSPGCTKEATAFRDNFTILKNKGAVILGISANNLAEHHRFIEKYELPFPLLSDIDHTVGKLYGVWVEKAAYGNKYWGIERTTFIIDKGGLIQAILSRLKPDEHPRRAGEIIDQIK